jgi:hypothetical protein
MEGLRQECTRLGTRRARYSHARTVAQGEGEGLPRHATLGHPWSGFAGGGSTAFSGDRARSARRKAVDAPEAPYRGGAGAPAPVARTYLSCASWQSLAAVCARVVAELGRRRRLPAVAPEDRLRREPAGAGLATQPKPAPVPGGSSGALTGPVGGRERKVRPSQ